MAYTTQAKIEAYKKRSLTAAEVVVLDDLLPAVDSIIYNIIDVTFDTGNDPQTFYYDGGCSVLDIPHLTAIDSVKYIDADGNLEDIAATEYVEYPLNSGRYSYIKKRSGTFTEGDGNVQVIGSGGAAPSEVTLAATIIASEMLDSDGGVEKREKIGDWEVEYETMSNTVKARVNALLMPYRSIHV